MTHMISPRQGAATPPGLRLTFVEPTGEPVSVEPGDAEHIPLDLARPARQIPSYRGQRHFPGYWWSATTGGHIVFESWLERHHIMAADRDPAVVAISSQPCLLTWPEGSRVRQHVPDLFLRRVDGTATLLDCRPVRRRDERFGEAADVNAAFCAQVGWGYAVVGEPEPVPAANLRWLAGYRHPRFHDTSVATRLDEAFAAPARLRDGANRVGDEIAVLPVAYHLMWRGVLRFDERAPLSLSTQVWAASSETPS
jgi:hypothetical protein